jgi:DNA-directed RNA polymerase specialized sigma24 family protein
VDRYSDEDIGNIQYKTTLNLDETIRIKTISTEDKMIEKEIKLSRKRQYEIARLCLSILDHETQKTVLTLFSDGLKYNEIAERLDMPKGTVMSSLARARIKVAECIKERLKNEQ